MSEIYMLDTNASSAAIRGDAAINAKLWALPKDAWCVSAVTMAEHAYGLAKKPQAVRLAQLVRAFLDVAPVLPWDHAAADVLGPVRAELERIGRPIGAYDTLIAAHALSRRLILVTANTAEFERVAGLRHENWELP
ncbi:PIN domain-containing protein [Variovorax saccharolyticus]|uniref:PIN domain-containing protein n=1 Tax=Variovorax saccharolyticus TaxID=3053516 RepID=UPI0025769116|nr:PIN domain-containing protein [Variovorax sp. J31P216]MDM0029100.1 PIN domain-containing protein [Variovorax sp. J31P216]